MKSSLPILAGLLAIAAPLGAQIKINIDPNAPATPASAPAAPAATAPAAAPAAPAAAPTLVAPGADGKYTDAQKFEVYGYIAARKLGLPEQVAPLLGSEDELVAFLRGMGVALAHGELPYDGKLIVPQAEEMVAERAKVVRAEVEKRIAEMKDKNGKEAAAFLATLDAKTGVKKAASGLRYEIIQEGTGAKAKPTQAVLANYKASFIDGQVFDTSENKQGKVEFPLATAIPGLKEGLQLVGVGGKVKLYVPAELGFGDKGPLPPGALTIFEVEILEVKEPAKVEEKK